MNQVIWVVLGVCLVAVVIMLGYWLLVVTEGVFLGRRVVVWLYDITAGRYDNIKQFDPSAEQFFVIRPFLARLATRPAPLILDVATGTGRVPRFLLEEPTFNGRVIGLDASAGMLAFVAPKLRPFRHRAAFVQQTAADLPFPDQSFDAVSCLEALEFFPDDVVCLQEMFRVLKPDGMLMLTRRRGWEARAFLGRYRDSEQFAELLGTIGLVNVETLPWQIEYDLIFAQKPHTEPGSDNA